MFLIKNVADILEDCRYLKNDINRFCLECKIKLLEQNGEYLEDLDNEKESILEKILNKSMEQYLLQCLKILDMKAQ